MDDNTMKKIDNQSKHEIIIQMRESYLNMPKISIHLHNDHVNQCDTETRADFIEYIATHCAADETSINLAVQSYYNGTFHSENNDNHMSNIDDDEEFQINRIQMTQRLRDACKPMYEHIFHFIDQTDRILGMSFLVQLREDIRSKIYIMNHSRNSHLHQTHNNNNNNNNNKQSRTILQRIKQLDSDLEKMLSLWFSAGILGTFSFTNYNKIGPTFCHFISYILFKHFSINLIQDFLNCQLTF